MLYILKWLKKSKGKIRVLAETRRLVKSDILTIWPYTECRLLVLLASHSPEVNSGLGTLTTLVKCSTRRPHCGTGHGLGQDGGKQGRTVHQQPLPCVPQVQVGHMSLSSGRDHWALRDLRKICQQFW